MSDTEMTVEKPEAVKENIKIIDIKDEIEGAGLVLLNPKSKLPFNIHNIHAIVLHQPTEVGEDMYTSFIPKIKNNTHKKIYHFAIDKEGVIFQLTSTNIATNNCDYSEYSDRAKAYFGERICHSDDVTDKFLSPTLKTISICLPKIDEEGNIGSYAIESCIKLCAFLINSIAPALQAQSNVICNYYIPHESLGFKDPLEFFSDIDFSKLTQQEIEAILNNKDDKNMIKNTKYLCFRYDIEKLRGEWLLKYKNKDGSSRGYPDIIYQTIEKKED